MATRKSALMAMDMKPSWGPDPPATFGDSSSGMSFLPPGLGKHSRSVIQSTGNTAEAALSASRKPRPVQSAKPPRRGPCSAATAWIPRFDSVAAVQTEEMIMVPISDIASVTVPGPPDPSAAMSQAPRIPGEGREAGVAEWCGGSGKRAGARTPGRYRSRAQLVGRGTPGLAFSDGNASIC